MATASLQTTIDPVDVAALQATPDSSATPLLPEGVPYRLSAVEFFRMVDADIIPRDCRVGLWEGQLYEKMGKNIPHSTAQDMVLLALIRVMPAGWYPGVEKPVLVNDRTAPLPDMVIVRGDPMTYYRRGSVPQMGEIGLVIEIADSTLKKNLTVSLQTYARAGLPIYWVVNLVANRVEVYSEPRTDEAGVADYAKVESFGPGAAVPLVLDGREVGRVPASHLLPEGMA